MELIQPLPQLWTAATAMVSNTLPSAAGDGVDVTAWKQGSGYQFANLVVAIEGDGTARTLDKPTSGGGGPELWTYRKDSTGTAKWWLLAYLNGGVICPVPAAGGRLLDATAFGIGDRLCVVGTVSAGAITYSFLPVEKSLHVGGR